jgi:nucleoside-diphosphate kinase
MPTQRTLILIKPDGVERRLVGRILSRFEERGLKILGLKMLRVTPELSKKHYAEHVNKPFYPLLESFITAGPIVAMVAEGPEAIAVVRDMLGPTNGRSAPPGTIRGDYGLSRQMNLVHGSDGPDAAAREIPLYFGANELVDHAFTLDGWICADDEK